jgi:hypothetical protein
MIASVLKIIRDDLAEFLNNQFAQDQLKVVVDKLVLLNGKSTIAGTSNQVNITLLDIQQERDIQHSRTSDLSQPYYLNLLLLFSAYEKEEDRQTEGYLRTLEYLNAVIQFFQQYPVFTPQTHNELPEGIEYLKFDLTTEDLRENSFIWTMTGAKHAPSVLYKVRSLPIGDRLAQRVSRMINGVSVL